MLKRFLRPFEPFIMMLVGSVVVASLLPPRGAWAGVFGVLTDAGIVALFFLHGARLSREAIVAGARNWRLHAVVMLTTFGLFPLLGVGIAALPGLSPTLAAGMLFLTLLPSTVQSSIAFTAMARGNVAAAVCSAAFSNLIGIFVTPALVAWLMHASGALSLDSIRTIALQLLLPFVLRHMLRPWIADWVARHKRLVTGVDRGSILLVVYTAFGAAVVEGLWHRVAPADLALLVLLCAVLLVVVLLATWTAGRLLRLPYGDAIVLLFCGSKKGLASGVPMAGVLFPAAQVGLVILPVMIFHQIQLIACALIAQHYARSEPAAQESEP